MPPRLIFTLVVLLLLVVVTAHIFASERAATEPCERPGRPDAAGGILQYVVPAA